jgi:hypothetical protein
MKKKGGGGKESNKIKFESTPQKTTTKFQPNTTTTLLSGHFV